MKTALLIILCSVLNAAAFDVRTYSEQIPESNPVTRVRVTHEGTQFSFAVLPGWKFGNDAQGLRVWLQPEDGQRSITLQITTNSPDADKLRQQVTNRWAGSLILNEFTAPSGGGVGVGIDLRRKVNDRIWMMTRICAYKAPRNAVEISMVAKPTDWEDLHPVWTDFINSFRLEPLQAAGSGTLAQKPE
jgi:hypothetical protein